MAAELSQALATYRLAYPGHKCMGRGYLQAMASGDVARMRKCLVSDSSPRTLRSAQPCGAGHGKRSSRAARGEDSRTTALAHTGAMMLCCCAAGQVTEDARDASSPRCEHLTKFVLALALLLAPGPGKEEQQEDEGGVARCRLTPAQLRELMVAFLAEVVGRGVDRCARRSVVKPSPGPLRCRARTGAWLTGWMEWRQTPAWWWWCVQEHHARVARARHDEQHHGGAAGAGGPGAGKASRSRAAGVCAQAGPVPSPRLPLPALQVQMSRQRTRSCARRRCVPTRPPRPGPSSRRRWPPRSRARTRPWACAAAWSRPSPRSLTWCARQTCCLAPTAHDAHAGAGAHRCCACVCACGPLQGVRCYQFSEASVRRVFASLAALAAERDGTPAPPAEVRGPPCARVAAAALRGCLDPGVSCWSAWKEAPHLASTSRRAPRATAAQFWQLTPAERLALLNHGLKYGSSVERNAAAIEPFDPSDLEQVHRCVPVAAH